MKYIVTLGWKCKFEFDHGDTSIAFASMALEHQSIDNDEHGVTITVTKEESEKGEGEEDADD